MINANVFTKKSYLCTIFPHFNAFLIHKKHMKNIKRIVLTGGPCAGKTTALVRIIEHFSSLGYKVFTIPEVPTLYSQGGWNYLTKNYNLYYNRGHVLANCETAANENNQSFF